MISPTNALVAENILAVGKSNSKWLPQVATDKKKRASPALQAPNPQITLVNLRAT